MPESWDRPGIERPHELSCQRAWSVELAAGPAHGSLTGFAFDDDTQTATWRYRPDADAPAEDAFDAAPRAAPAAPPTQRVTVHVTPAPQNTAPQCRPASEARRTDGTGPAVVELDLSCWDYENDTIVLDGGGPGEHLDGPRTVAGGDGGGADVPRLALPHRDRPRRGVDHVLGHRRPRRPLDRHAAERPGRPRRRPAADLRAEPGLRRPRAPFLPIYARPGATRRFGLVCSDADHDPLSVGSARRPPAAR